MSGVPLVNGYNAVEVIERLTSVDAGDRELDFRLWVTINNCEVKRAPQDNAPRSSELFVWKGRSLVAAVGDDFDPELVIFPAYTTTVDAVLPWENIAIVRAPTFHDGPSNTWEAAAVISSRRGGGLVFGYAATEPLARRTAAMKARIA